MRTNKTNVLAMILIWAVVAVWFLEDLRTMITDVIAYLGPMGLFLVPIAIYILIMTVVIIQNRHHYSPRHRELLLEHLEDIGEVAAVCGLLGTILAMITSSSNGTPDMSRFLQSLYSTFIGSGISVLTSAFRTIMTRPETVPVNLRTVLKEKRHE